MGAMRRGTTKAAQWGDKLLGALGGGLLLWGCMGYPWSLSKDAVRVDYYRCDRNIAPQSH